MKSENGMGMIKLFFTIVIIVMAVAGIMYYLQTKYTDVKIETISTDMLQIQWKVKAYIDNQTANGEEISYLGTKVSEMQDDALITEFLSQNILTDEEKDKFYVLSNDDLAGTGIEIMNYEGSYFLVNYDTYEIVVTVGCKYSEEEVLYRLSEIEEKEKEQAEE